MQREYIGYVGLACKEGLKPEEVQSLFDEIYSKTNTKQGKRVLRLFARGIGKAKQKSLEHQHQVAPEEIQPELTQQKSYQYVYRKY